MATSPDESLPLLLLPASLCDRALWRHQLEALQGRVAIRLADLTQDDSTAAMAARILSTVPGHFAVAGLSMGAYVALELVRQAPDRVRKLALLGPRPDRTRRPRHRAAGIFWHCASSGHSEGSRRP